MEELAHKLQRLVHTRTLNVHTHDPGKIRYRGSRLLPLAGEEPRVGELCRSVVVGKDEGRRELVLHLTYVLEEERSVYINHLGLRGYIRDYDLKEEFSIFTYLGNFKQIALGSEIVAQVRAVVLREEKKHFELTLKTGKRRQGRMRAGVRRDQCESGPREWRLFEKFGWFPANFMAQYEEEWANPGLVVQLCREGRLEEGESLDSGSLVGALGDLALDYERLIFGMKQSSAVAGKAVGGQAFHGRSQVPESPTTRNRT